MIRNYFDIRNIQLQLKELEVETVRFERKLRKLLPDLIENQAKLEGDPDKVAENCSNLIGIVTQTCARLEGIHKAAKYRANPKGKGKGLDSGYLQGVTGNIKGQVNGLKKRLEKLRNGLVGIMDFYNKIKRRKQLAEIPGQIKDIFSSVEFQGVKGGEGAILSNQNALQEGMINATGVEMVLTIFTITLLKFLKNGND